MDTNILLESGTNELEILEFTLGDNHYEYTSECRRHFYAARGDDYGHQSKKVSWHGG